MPNSSAETPPTPAAPPAPEGARAQGIRGKRYIVVEGPIGVGKTTLARKIAAALNIALSLEQSDDNPFLERFYRARAQYALQTQLFFLFQRTRQLQKLRQGDLFAPACVADFMLAKDPLFARLTLDEDELRLYEHVYRHFATETPRPDLVIYLQAPAEVLAARIRKRGILFERNIERAYLEELIDSYARFFLNYRESPLLMVNAEKLNFLDNDDHFAMLLEQAGAITSGRHYFNPVL